MRRFSAFLLPVLITCAFLVTANSAWQPAAISSYGMISSQTSNYSYGLLCKDFSYGPPYGDDWTYQHIDMVADAGGNYVYYDIDRTCWEDNDYSNFLGVSFWDYLKEMVSYGNQRGIKSILGVGTDYFHADIDGDGEGWGRAERNSVVMAAIYAPQGVGQYSMTWVNEREAWIEWGRQMIGHCDPWGVCIMDEPSRTSTDYPMTEQDYWDFASECITEWQKVKPDVYVMTYNGGGSRGNRNLSQYHTNPLHKPNGPHDHVLYCTVAYLWSFGQYATSREAGKAQLEQWMQDRAIYGDVAALTIPFVGAEYTSEAGGNWQWYMEDIYDFCFTNCYGLTHFCAAFAPYYADTHWNMLTNDGNGWSVFGQFWVDYTPT